MTNYDLRFHESNDIHPTAIIYDCVDMGKNNKVGPFTVIGGNGEIRGKDQSKFEGRVFIGDNNVISEHVTIQRPFEKGAKTIIGDGCYVMTKSHVSHDCTVGNNVEICGGVLLLGYVTIEDNAMIKVGSLIRNRKNIGVAAVVGMGSNVVKDVKDGETVVGNPAKTLIK